MNTGFLPFFKNLPEQHMFNEAYAADIARKVAAQQRQAMQDGEFVGSRPPYGYRKAPDNCHRLLVNEDTAPVVRQIFQWAANGVALNEMVKRLNGAGVLTPGHYLASVGLITNQRLMGSGKWQTWTVGKLLDDEVYTGDMVQGKTRVVNHRQVPADPADWIVVRDTHEALVSRELFEQAQAMRGRAAAKYTRTEKKPYTENILRGRVFCGCCGKTLHRQRHQGGYYVYHCISNERIGKNACSAKVYVRDPDLFGTIVTIIRQKAEVVIGNGLRLKRQDHKIAEQRAEVEREIGRLSRETERNRALLAGLYENLVTGVLTKAEYHELKKEYNEKIKAAVERTRQLQTRQRALEDQARDYTCLADRLAAVDKDTALSALLVEQIIERVTVNSPDDVTIRFRFESGFDSLMEVLDG